MQAALKSSTLAFEGSFVSDSSGSIRAYLASDEVRKLFGQATGARISVVGTSMTSTCRIQLRLYDTATPRMRPTELEQSYPPFFSTGLITSLVPQPIDVTGDWCDNVDIVLEVDDSAASSKQEWTGTIYITLFFN